MQPIWPKRYTQCLGNCEERGEIEEEMHPFMRSHFDRSPNSSSTFNSYSGQLAVSVQDGNAPWTEDEYQRGQSSSVSPRGGYCSSASTPHSSGGGSYGGGNGNAYAPNIGALSSTSSSVFNSTSSKPIHRFEIETNIILHFATFRLVDHLCFVSYSTTTHARCFTNFWIIILISIYLTLVHLFFLSFISNIFSNEPILKPNN